MDNKNMSIKTQTLEVIIEKDEPEGYHAYCPSLPGCHSQGATTEEARENIAEAIEGYLESLAVRKKPLPEIHSKEIRVEHFMIPSFSFSPRFRV